MCWTRSTRPRARPDAVTGIDLEALRGGNRRALAKAITLVESSLETHREEAQHVLEALLPDTGNSIRVGISGVPGVGKSTFIETFGLYLISQGKKVAVLAVDPSSPIAGGSILGDKTRMEQLSRRDEAFIRPSPSSGALGGVVDGVGGVVNGVGDAVGGLVDGIVGTVTGGAPPEGHTASGGVAAADIDLHLVGTATPGAHLSLQAGGLVYATTTVSSNGTFALNVTGIPGGLSSLDLVQTVDRDYLAGIVGDGGLLGGIVGTLDGLINDLIKPLSLSSGNTQGLNIRLLN